MLTKGQSTSMQPPVRRIVGCLLKEAGILVSSGIDESWKGVNITWEKLSPTIHMQTVEVWRLSAELRIKGLLSSFFVFWYGNASSEHFSSLYNHGAACGRSGRLPSRIPCHYVLFSVHGGHRPRPVKHDSNKHPDQPRPHLFMGCVNNEHIQHRVA